MYADDIVLTGNNLEEISHISSLLEQNFHINNLRDLIYLLGLEIAHNYKDIHVFQRKYTLNLLTDTRMLACALPSIVMVYSLCLSTDTKNKLDKAYVSPYRRLIGRLIYLTNIHLT